MRTDLSNEVIARIADDATKMPRRMLDLQRIATPELGLLSPQRNEIAPRGRGRDAALIAYSERLRQSYRTNEAGIRDGMLKLGEAYRGGQTIAISCFCRAGEMCHADVVKLAVQKVAGSIVREAERHKAEVVAAPTKAAIRSNPRTERAVNEILSIGKTDVILSKLEDTEGRNRSEQASHLNQYSQFIRDLYERGAVVRDGALISPTENPSSSAPLAITTVEYAVKRLKGLVNESKAKDLAPEIIGYANKIAGPSADRESKIKVFNWIYGALEGKGNLLDTEQRVLATETREERFERTLTEVASLAEEMARLEPSDRLIATEIPDAHEALDRLVDELSLENIYDHALLRDEHESPDAEHALGTTQDFERVELEDTTLSRWASEMSQEELDRWINVRLPVIDELIEEGTPVDTILKPFENDIYHAAKENESSKQAAIDDLKFASRYIDHQLKQPESRLRHFNPRYRSYAEMLEKVGTKEDLIDVASRIRFENAKVGFQWEKLDEKSKSDIPRPLTSKEMQFLFTEASPRHYTREMTATRLSYSVSGEAARAKTDALMRGEIGASKEAMQLIESLESRLERRRSSDSLAATKHFLQSLKTPNEELRLRNPFDHAEVYRKLPPAERDFVYQRAVLQKSGLEERVFDAQAHEQLGKVPISSERISVESGSALRADLKSDLVGSLEGVSVDTGKKLVETTLIVLEKNLSHLIHGRDAGASLQNLSKEFAENMLSRISMARGNTLDKERLPNSRTRSSTQEIIPVVSR
jgi:hypothetical protein